MVARLITADELQVEFGESLFKQVFADRSGTLDTSEGSLCDSLIQDASSAILGALGGAYDIDALLHANDDGRVYELKRLCRRLCRSFAATRFEGKIRLSPEDAFKMEKETFSQLKALREADRRLDSKDVVPANVGGSVANTTGGKLRYSLNSDGFGDY